MGSPSPAVGILQICSARVIHQRVIATPRPPPKVAPLMRSGTWSSTSGSPSKGAESCTSTSRTDASACGSPPSRASVQTRLASWSPRQPTDRGPVGAESRPIGISSWRGRSATSRTTAPLRSRISIRCGNREYGTSHENGSWTVLTSRKFASGDGAKRSMIPGPAISVASPERSTTTARAAP